MSLHKRLEALEAHTQAQQGYKVPRRVERYLHIFENANRRARGIEPLPDLPYTEEDYEDDLRTLHEHIPAMRANPGCQTEESRTFLDSWERNVQERTEGINNDEEPPQPPHVDE